MVPLVKEWNITVIALSYMIGFLASYASTLSLSMMERSPSRISRTGFLALSCSLYGGCCVWALHFCGMSALDLGVPVSYDPSLTVISLLVAVLGAIGAFFVRFRNIFQIASMEVHTAEEIPLLEVSGDDRTEEADEPHLNLIQKTRRDPSAVLGGLLLSVAVASMHFIGMAAMRADDLHVRYCVSWIVFAFIAGWAFAAISIASMPRVLDFRRQLRFSFFSSLSVFSLHYLAMVGATFSLKRQELPPRRESSVNWTIVFALCVFTVVMCFSAIAVVAQTISRQRDSLMDAVRAKRYITVLETERESLRKLNERKTEFMAIVSHELRTPLHGLSGFVRLIEESPLNEDQAENVRLARQSVSAMELVVDNVLNLTTLENRGVVPKPQWGRLSEVIFTIMETLFGGMTRDLLILYANEVPAEEEELVDVNLYTQVSRNLISNAYKFTEKGYVLVTFWYQSGRAFLSVRDTGVGITSEAMQGLFQPYNQPDKTLAREHDGTGIGLAISNGVAISMKGNIRVQSSPQGSVFTFEVPVPARGSERHLSVPFACPKIESDYPLVSHAIEHAFSFLNEELKVTGATTGCAEMKDITVRTTRSGVTAENQDGVIYHRQDGAVHLRRFARETWHAKLQMNEHASSKTPPLQEKVVTDVKESKEVQTSAVTKGKILVVEDNKINSRLIVKTLKRMGWDCQVAENGMVALELLASGGPESYSGILMDCQMPVMDGFQTTREIRKTDKKIPIIALTANVTDGSKEAALAAGMNGFLEKPLDQSKLLTVLSAWETNET
jgi:signal transduction histidine kinase/CheY-like chemotaxis protein